MPIDFMKEIEQDNMFKLRKRERFMAQKIFDAHFHIIDPHYSIIKNNGFLPNYHNVDQYKKYLKSMGLQPLGGAEVQGTFQGDNQDHFKGDLSQLGKNFVGITRISKDISDKDLQFLSEIGIRGIRFPMYRGIKESLPEIKEIAKRVYFKFGWGTEIYLDLAKANSDLIDLILSLPKVSIDHLGMTKAPLSTLTKLLGHGVAIRVSGFGRVQYSRSEIKELLPKLYQVNPKGLIFATDFPGTRTKHPFSLKDIDLIKTALGNDERAINRVLYQNGINWYLK